MNAILSTMEAVYTSVTTYQAIIGALATMVSISHTTDTIV